MAAIELSVDGGRAEVCLNRPDVLNAMNIEMFETLATVCDEIAARDGVHVVVVRGEGGSFCSGIDLASLGDQMGADPGELIARAQAGFRKLSALPMPTVAAVQGHAYGAGLQVALACDIRVVTRSAKLGLLEMRYGLIPDLGGSNRLPQLVGPGRAKRMIWLAERIDGPEAERIGLAEWCVEDEDLDEITEALVARLAEPPHLAKRLAKEVVDASWTTTLSEGMDNEARAQARCLTSPEFGEAVARAFSS